MRYWLPGMGMSRAYWRLGKIVVHALKIGSIIRNVHIVGIKSSKVASPESVLSLSCACDASLNTNVSLLILIHASSQF